MTNLQNNSDTAFELEGLITGIKALSDILVAMLPADAPECLHWAAIELAYQTQLASAVFQTSQHHKEAA